jgi:type III pantothenate kinase
VTTCLQLDVGNSSAKWRVVTDGSVTGRGRYVRGDDGSRQALLDAVDDPDHIWVSSVASERAEAELRQLLATRWRTEPWFARTEAATGDLVNSYSEPARMGVDRWLAMLGAWARGPGPLCVVDAGSALTIDLVDASGRHRGGYIIPGPMLMERALLLDTDRVRFEENVEPGLAPGTSTAEAVRHGIALAQAGAVALALEREPVESSRVYYCGGGGELLMRLTERGGIPAPDLVFEGLAVMARLHGGVGAAAPKRLV